jgi:hypothetical protein
MATSFQDGREEGAVRSPVTLDVERAAEAVEAMIRRRKRSVTKSAWMLTALKLKSAFA